MPTVALFSYHPLSNKCILLVYDVGALYGALYYDPVIVNEDADETNPVIAIITAQLPYHYIDLPDSSEAVIIPLEPNGPSGC